MHKPPHHLTYCLNVHPGETWLENLAAIQIHALAIRDQVAPGKPFGLGMRLSQQSATTLNQPDNLATFKRFMNEQNLYAFTINGFPYGAFHTKPVKTAVYKPDWSTTERLNYTISLAQILSELLPAETEGSISTLPLGYKYTTGSDAAVSPSSKRVSQLAECAAVLHEIHMKTGKVVHIGLEPEPDCLLETTEEVIQFFDKQFIPQAIPQLVSRLSCNRKEAEAILRRHVGICFDTCHLAIQFEDLAASLTRLVRHGIRISKVQLSAALEVVPTVAARLKLHDFIDPVYLHQVKALQLSQHTEPRSSDHTHPPVTLDRYADLDQALAIPANQDNPAAIWRIHFHLPLYFEGQAPLHSTATALDSRFWDQLRALPVYHLEIETYTFHVLPPSMQAAGVVASTVREYEWVARRLNIADNG